MGTDIAGMAHNLIRLFEGLPQPQLAAARLPADPVPAIDRITLQVPKALTYGPSAAAALRANCVAQFDWNSLATRLLSSLATTRRTHAA